MTEIGGAEISNWFTDYLQARRETTLARTKPLPDALASFFQATEGEGGESIGAATGLHAESMNSLGSLPTLSSTSLHTLLTTAMFVTGVFTIYTTLFHVTAPYGRHSTATGWGILVNPRLAWMVMESPNLWWCLYYYCKGDGFTNLPAANIILILIFSGHYINRSLVYPLRISAGSKAMPIAVMLSATFYCTWNGYIQSKFLFELERFEDEVLSSDRFILGTLLFFTGFCINYHSDHVMRNLRKPGETGYVIPRGGMFKYVSGANFFGEIVEWIGFGIAGGWTGVAFAFFTFCNTAPRGHAHHKWYLQKFGDEYPKERKAVIPFIW